MTAFVRFYRLETSPRNTGIAVVFGEWPERVLRHRGYTDARRIWGRVTTASEDDWLATCNRHQAYWYGMDALPGLIADEVEAGVAPERVRQLAALLGVPETANA